MTTAEGIATALRSHADGSCRDNEDSSRLLACEEEASLSIHAGPGACFACFLRLRGPVLVNEDCSGLVLYVGGGIWDLAPYFVVAATSLGHLMMRPTVRSQ